MGGDPGHFKAWPEMSGLCAGPLEGLDNEIRDVCVLHKVHRKRIGFFDYTLRQSVFAAPDYLLFKGADSGETERQVNAPPTLNEKTQSPVAT